MLNLPFRGGGGGGDACLVLAHSWKRTNLQLFSPTMYLCPHLSLKKEKKKETNRVTVVCVVVWYVKIKMIFLLCVCAHWDIPARMNWHVMWCLRGLTETLLHVSVSPCNSCPMLVESLTWRTGTPLTALRLYESSTSKSRKCSLQSFQRTECTSRQSVLLPLGM